MCVCMCKYACVFVYMGIFVCTQYMYILVPIYISI